jgi:Arc-like DNA binding domain
MVRRKPADTVQLKLRFPERLRRRIEAAAAKNQQSMNLEIVERLERSFQHEDEDERTSKAAQEATAIFWQALVNLGFVEPPESRTDAEWQAEYEKGRESDEEMNRAIDQEVERLRALKRQPPKKRGGG